MTAYAELHCKSNYSFLEGASHADELVATARNLGYAALAVTDRDSLAGVVRAHVAAKERGLKLIVGAEIHPCDAPTVVLWAPDRRAYGRLCRLITVGRRRAEKGACELAFADIAAHADGLLAGVVPESDTRHETRDTSKEYIPRSQALLGNASREAPLRMNFPDSRGKVEDQKPDAKRSFATCVPKQSLGTRGQILARDALAAYRDVFGDRAYLLAELFRGPDDARRLRQLQDLSRESRLLLLAANDVHYHTPERLPLHDVLTAVRHGTTVAAAEGRLFPNAERHLRPIPEIVAAFAADPAAVRRTLDVADRCTFRLDELRYEYPEELVPAGLTPDEYLAQLTWQGAAKYYPYGIPDKVRKLLEHELALIRELRYEAYFLTVQDLVRFAREKEILCQGRGSAANSAVCFCLGVTAVDPDQIDVLFERFISKERDEAPDIDVDFEHERREEVLQYLYEKYGRDRAGLAATVITYRGRSAIRDVGKALGLSPDRVTAIARQVEGYGRGAKAIEDSNTIDPSSQIGMQLQNFVGELIGFPRHLSQHVGGMVITRGPLCELVPIENASMPDRSVVQWDKDDLDALGILKVDCLALGMLTAIRKCFDLVEQHHGRPLTLATVPPEDPITYDMICEADTIGVFQIESRAQMSMLPRLQPRRFYDLVIEVAIVRPGPIQGQMVHPYLRRRKGEEQFEYPSKEIEAVLSKTLGVPLFQEQAMKLAVVAAGFTPGEADQLRRAMGAWRRSGVIEQFRTKLIDGMQARGLTAEFAERVYKQICGFGEYGFPESHAAAFAHLAYVSAWLKCHYPAAFTAALLNSQPMGFYATAQLVQDARKHDVPVLPVDVNHSDNDCTLERVGDTLALRLGFCMVAGLRDTSAVAIMAARADGPFQSVSQFTRRTRLGRPDVERLADADAFGSLALGRRDALWHSLAQARSPSASTLFAAVVDADECESLPPLSSFEQVIADYRATGLSLKGHPMAFYRDQLDRLSVLPSQQLAGLPHRRRVSVAGIVLVRQRPATASGVTFCTLEDETGTTNLIIWKDTWDRHTAVARGSPVWIAHGVLERKDGVMHVVVERIESMPTVLGELCSTSRDFH